MYIDYRRMNIIPPSHPTLQYVAIAGGGANRYGLVLLVQKMKLYAKDSSTPVV